VLTGGNSSPDLPHKTSGHLPQEGLFSFCFFDKISLRVNFQPNINLAEMAIKTRRQKVLKEKPPGDLCSLLEAFLFKEWIGTTYKTRR
jgi:hypothetical protein